VFRCGRAASAHHTPHTEPEGPPMDSVKQKKIALVRQMLAQAESTNHPAEAEAFTAAAEQLMIRHGIEEAMLAVDEQSPIGRRTIYFRGRYARVEIDSAVAIAQSLGAVYPLYVTHAKGGHVYLYGRESQNE